MEKEYGKGAWEILLMYLKENLKTIKNLAMEYTHGSQEINTRVIILMISDTVMGKCIGQMILIIKDNGIEGFKVEKECYKFPVKVKSKAYLSTMCFNNRLKIIQIKIKNKVKT